MKKTVEQPKVTGTVNDWFNKMPNSVLFVKAMASIDRPIGLETYERALKEGPEYFPEEIEYRRKLALIPQDVKDAYSAEHQSLYWNYESENMPDEVRHWKGIAGATEHDWKVWNEWHNSDEYKDYQKHREQQEIDCYNKHFSPYGLTK